MTIPSYIVVPFMSGHGTAVRPGKPMCVNTRSYARLLAKLAAPHYAGVAIIEQPANEFEEPRLAKAIGRVPVSILALAVPQAAAGRTIPIILTRGRAVRHE